MKKRISKKLIKRCKDMTIILYDGYKIRHIKISCDITMNRSYFIIFHRDSYLTIKIKFIDINKIVRCGKYITMYKRYS